MNKNIARLSTIAALCLVANNAIAAVGVAELTVKGEIAPPSCMIELGQNGVVDLGKISSSNIQASAETKLPEPAAINLNASCDGATSLTFSIVDNRMATASAPSASHFGLGTVNSNGKLGYYRIKMQGGYVDNKEVELFSAPKSSASFTPAKEVEVATDKVMGWSVGGNNQLAIGKYFSSQLQLTPHLASAKDMGGTVPDDTKLDGSATLSFAFGI